MKRLLLILALLFSSARSDINIVVQGYSGLSKRKLLEVISPEPEEYDQDGLRSWREDAEFYLADSYRASGYFEVQIKSELKKRGADPKDWDATFTINEGPRYIFDSVRVVGADLNQRESAAADSGKQTKGAAGAPTLPVTVDSGAALPDTSARPPPGPAVDPGDLAARPGKPFRDDAMLVDRRFLLRRFGNAGFVRVEVDDKVDVRPNTKTVAVDYLVDPGRPVIFDTVLIRNTRAPPMDTMAGITKEGMLASLVRYDRGDTVRASSNDKLVEKLQYTGAFNYVRIKDSLMADSSGRSALFLYTEEHVPGNLRGSIFYETQYGPGVSVDARHSNVAGSLNELRTGFSIAKDRQTLYGGYGSPLTLGYLIRFDDDITFDWFQDKPIHDSLGFFRGDFRWANSSRLTWPWSYWLRLVGDAELEATSRIITLDSLERDLSLNFIQTAFLTFVNQPILRHRG
ncbi:MAG: hypothetical protein JWO30_3563 [Fibrobacteres bacterium]|nr:hypothetical protein [Fibrobacterota bacterium]